MDDDLEEMYRGQRRQLQVGPWEGDYPPDPEEERARAEFEYRKAFPPGTWRQGQAGPPDEAVLGAYGYPPAPYQQQGPYQPYEQQGPPPPYQPQGPYPEYQQAGPQFQPDPYANAGPQAGEGGPGAPKLAPSPVDYLRAGFQPQQGPARGNAPYLSETGREYGKVTPRFGEAFAPWGDFGQRQGAPPVRIVRGGQESEGFDQMGIDASPVGQSVRNGMLHLKALEQQVRSDPQLSAQSRSHALARLYDEAAQLAHNYASLRGKMQPGTPSQQQNNASAQLDASAAGWEKQYQDHAIDQGTYLKGKAEIDQRRMALQQQQQVMQMAPNPAHAVAQKAYVDPDTGVLFHLDKNGDPRPAPNSGDTHTALEIMKATGTLYDVALAHVKSHRTGQPLPPNFPPLSVKKDKEAAAAFDDLPFDKQEAMRQKEEAHWTQRHLAIANHIDSRLQHKDADGKVTKGDIPIQERDQAVAQEHQNAGLAPSLDEHMAAWERRMRGRRAMPQGAPAQQGAPPSPTPFDLAGAKARAAGDRAGQNAAVAAKALIGQYRNVDAMPPLLRYQYREAMVALKRHYPGIEVPTEERLGITEDVKKAAAAFGAPGETMQTMPSGLR